MVFIDVTGCWIFGCGGSYPVGSGRFGGKGKGEGKGWEGGGGGRVGGEGTTLSPSPPTPRPRPRPCPCPGAAPPAPPPSHAHPVHEGALFGRDAAESVVVELAEDAFDLEAVDLVE